MVQLSIDNCSTIQFCKLVLSPSISCLPCCDNQYYQLTIHTSHVDYFTPAAGPVGAEAGAAEGAGLLDAAPPPPPPPLPPRLPIVPRPRP
jgi:hypothetical protein